MKVTSILKIVGFVLLGLAIILIMLGFNVFSGGISDPFNIKPVFIFLGFITLFGGLVSLMMGFVPQQAKLQSKIKSETIDYAGEDIKQATSKSADTIIPAVTPAIKQSVHEIRENKESKLIEAKELLNKDLITKEEYDEMRKKILGIN